MMEESVADTRLVNVAGLGVADAKVLVSAVPVAKYGHAVSIFQIIVKGENVVHQTILKFLHVLFLPLSAHKLFPRLKEILY